MTSRGTKFWNSGAIPLIAPEILGDIIADVADVGIVVSANGSILSVLVNPLHDVFRRLEHWEGKDIRTALTVESIPKFEARLRAFLRGEPVVRPVELNHVDSIGSWEFPIRYSFHRIGPDGAILMLGRDLRVIAEMQQQLVKAQMALERDYEAQREYDTRFRVLIETTRDPVVFVSVQNGKITDANALAARLFERSREDLIGQSIGSEVEVRSRGDLLDVLASRAVSDSTAPVKIKLRRSGQSVQIYPTLFRAAGERLILCRIETDDDQPAVGDALADHLNGLYQFGPNAIVFTDDDGMILSANEGFLDLINAGHDLVLRGRSLADYLHRGSVDLKIMAENATRVGRMRMYATKMVSEFGSPRPVELSVTRIQAGASVVFAFVIRDTSRIDVMTAKSDTALDDNVRAVIDLVGSATLKEIVAETTNVVEKMCIETAVELTMNNRVAAAEMLGLSRQSLYVKLRKFDLLNKGGE